MPVNGVRQANLLDKGALGALETPTRRRSGSFMGSAVVRQEGESTKTPCKTDSNYCICGKNRESAARDKRDLLRGLHVLVTSFLLPSGSGGCR